MTSPKNPRLPELSALDAHRIHQWLEKHFEIETEATHLADIFRILSAASYDSGFTAGWKMGFERGRVGALPQPPSD